MSDARPDPYGREGVTVVIPAESGAQAVVPGVARLSRIEYHPPALILDLSADEEFDRLERLFPPKVQPYVTGRLREIEEVRMIAHGPLEVLYRHAHVLYPMDLTREEMALLDSVGQWRRDGRLGIEGTLHRLAREATYGHTSVVTVRVARAYLGVAEPFRLWLEDARDGLFLFGVAGSGKTAMMRDANRILAEALGGRLFVNDSSNEVYGDGYRPHKLMGLATRIPIGDPARQTDTLNRVLKNFQPRWMEVDEVSTLTDARSIAYARAREARVVLTFHAGSLHEAYHEQEERTLWPLIQRNEQGLTGRPAAGLGIQLLSRGEYLVFENMARAFEEVAAGRLPEAVYVRVAQDAKWGHRERVEEWVRWADAAEPLLSAPS